MYKKIMINRKNLSFSSGERYATLVDENGVPDFWTTLFVTIELRPSHTQNAMLNILQDLVHFKLWEELYLRNTLAEFGEGRFLSDADIIGIRDHCAFQTLSLRKWLRTPIKANIIKFNRSRAIKSGQFLGVSKAHQSNRMTHIAKYLAFIAQSLLRRRGNVSELIPLISDMEARILKQRPRVTGKARNNEPDDKAPPPKAFEELMRTISVDSANNPYKNEGIRLRNNLMFEVMYHTGIRSGELLSLRVEDLSFADGDSKIYIRRRHDDPFDSRAHQPVVKTLERSIPIPSRLAKQLRVYILEIRARIDGATRHPYVFVTHHRAKAHQGSPVSDSTFRNRILQPAIQGNPELFEEITRHGFRHTFNYKLSKRIDEQNGLALTDASVKSISEKEEMQIRKYLNGWKSDSTAATYNQRHIKETADELMKQDAQSQLKNFKKSK